MFRPHSKTFQNLTRVKKNRIRQAAVTEFGEKGYTAASINTMVQRLGIAKGSIFQYFGDKKGLFLFVFDSAMTTVKNYLKKVREKTKEKPLFDRLEATLLAGVFFLKKHPLIYRLYLKILFEYDIPHREELLLTIRRYSFEYLRSLLEDAQERGELREGVDLDRVCFVLDAIMDRFLQAQAIPHLDAGLGLYQCSEGTARQWVAQLMQMLRLGIGGDLK